MDDRRMTVKDVAEYLQLSTDQIYRLAQQGMIPAFRVGARWRFKQEKIDHWMEQQRTGNGYAMTASAGLRSLSAKVKETGEEGAMELHLNVEGVQYILGMPLEDPKFSQLVLVPGTSRASTPMSK